MIPGPVHMIERIISWTRHRNNRWSGIDLDPHFEYLPQDRIFAEVIFTLMVAFFAAFALLMLVILAIR